MTRDPHPTAVADYMDCFVAKRTALALLGEVTARLRHEVEIRYGTLTDQPRLQRKIQADLAPVIEAELFLAQQAGANALDQGTAQLVAMQQAGR